MQVLISDANILIDMEVGGLLEPLFALPFQFKVADLLYYDELEEQHPHLPELGLQITGLSATSMTEAMRLTVLYGSPSRYDCFALALAKQEDCPLLTGDGRLRKAAKQEAVVVMGTIWLVEQMVIHQIIDKAMAEAAYDQMEASGSRLPWKQARARLAKL